RALRGASPAAPGGGPPPPLSPGRGPNPRRPRPRGRYRTVTACPRRASARQSSRPCWDAPLTPVSEMISMMRMTLPLPRIDRVRVWSIGIYTGKSPFALRPPAGVVNPVLTAQHVTDVRARYVADPFMLRHESSWYMFFEVLE